MRVAIVDKSLCRPDKCNRECVVFCPVNRSGAKAIWIDEETGKAFVDERTCIACGICVKKCPFNALTIINLPEELEKRAVHRYGPNEFKLYGLPIPKENRVVGIIGVNGAGKSTALRILGGKLIPNLGDPGRHSHPDEVVRYFRGTELQAYFEKLYNSDLKAVYKPQSVDLLPRHLKGPLRKILQAADEKGAFADIVEQLGLKNVLDRNIRHLSGGELQKTAVAITMLRDADIYLIDEPASYLDVKERLRVARAIRSLASPGRYVVLVEHDLAVLDYLSDLIHIVYGEPGAYGIFSLPRGVRQGINSYLKGFLREENLRIRNYPIEFHVHPPPPQWSLEDVTVKWSDLRVVLNGFELLVEEGELHRGEVVGILGPNGIGKTTFVKTIAGILEPSEGWVEKKEGLKISYKPQFITHVEFDGTLEQYLRYQVGLDLSSSYIRTELLKPLQVERLLLRKVSELSGGELQRASIVAALGREADIYLLDEPMAYLDIEQRYAVAKVIKKLTNERGVSTFVVEHDIVAQDFVATSIMVFSGDPGKRGVASPPVKLRDGMNRFLKEVGVTFRRDPETLRPRINKEGSVIDRMLKHMGEYYYTSVELPGAAEEEAL